MKVFGKVFNYIKASRYRIFLVIYTASLLVLMTVGIIVFNGFASKYDEHMPENTVNAFMRERDGSYWYKLVYNRYSSKTTSFESANDVIRKLGYEGIDTGKLTYHKRVSDYEKSAPAYTVYYEGKEFATVKLRSNKKVMLGLNEWQVDTVTLSMNDSEANSVSVSVTCPPETKISVNGIELGKQYIKESRVDYPNVSEFEKGLDGIPYRVKYIIDGLFDIPTVKAADENGKELALDIDNYDFSVGRTSDVGKNIKVNIPAMYKLTVNGKNVGAEYITDDSASYALLDGVTGYKGSKPAVYTYDIGSLMLEPEIKVQDENGKDVACYRKENGVYHYGLQSSDEVKAKREDRVIDFTKCYLYYISQGAYNTQANFASLNAYLLQGSSAATIMKQGINGISWNSRYSVEYNKLEVDNFVEYGDGCFSCTVTYDTDFVHGNINKKEAAKLMLVFVKSGNQYLVSKFEITV